MVVRERGIFRVSAQDAKVKMAEHFKKLCYPRVEFIQRRDEPQNNITSLPRRENCFTVCRAILKQPDLCRSRKRRPRSRGADFPFENKKKSVVGGTVGVSGCDRGIRGAECAGDFFVRQLAKGKRKMGGRLAAAEKCRVFDKRAKAKAVIFVSQLLSTLGKMIL